MPNPTNQKHLNRSGIPGQDTIPESLLAWAPPHILVTLTLEAVEQTDNRYARGPALHREFHGFQPKCLLAALAHSYALGIYESESIHTQVRKHPGLAYLAAGTQPSAETLMRFRRTYKELVIQCLECLLKLAWTFRFEQTQHKEIDWEICDIITRDEWMIPSLERGLRIAAEERVRRAIRADTAFFDT